MKTLSLLAFLSLPIACGASLGGPATDASGSRCGGHMDCGEAGCCLGAAFDDEAWQCLPAGAVDAEGKARGPCEYEGLSPDPIEGMGARFSRDRPRR